MTFSISYRSALIVGLRYQPYHLEPHNDFCFDSPIRWHFLTTRHCSEQRRKNFHSSTVSFILSAMGSYDK